MQATKQATATTVNYVPNSQKEWKQLLAYIDTVSANTFTQRKTTAYFAETNVCSEILSKHFKVNPPQRIVKVCPWKQLGVSATIQTIARKYSIPVYMVTSDVHSALSY
tara:strand:- start:59 stop:382 length:324 start_codon:yes stop_codon:yes gene_type:complete